jgi:hypothetical protein
MRNTFAHRRDITGENFADRAKNSEGYITIPALQTSEIAPLQPTLRGETLLAKAQKLPRPPNTTSKSRELNFFEWHGPYPVSILPDSVARRASLAQTHPLVPILFFAPLRLLRVSQTGTQGTGWMRQNGTRPSWPYLEARSTRRKKYGTS